MKRFFYILIAASIALFASCAKDDMNGNSDNSPSNPALTGRTLTFAVDMDMPTQTKANLELAGLDIKWQSGDTIGIATDNDATIRRYAVVPNDSDKKKGTIAVAEVAGAKTYYAIFKGSLGDGGKNENAVTSGDFSMLSFNTTTKTFSGLKVGQQQVAEGSLESHIWYTNGYPLSMAGVADGDPNSDSHLLVMRPCLALFQLQIAKTSFPEYYKNIPYESSYSINHDHYYSAIRGFNLYQNGATTIYSNGDYSVQIASDGSLTTTPGATKQEYRQISQSDTLKAKTKYLMCLIPGGSVSSFTVDFLGYKSNGKASGDLNWSAVYTMTKSGSFTVAPGDFYDLGTLNPISRKIAQNIAADESTDAAAASYVPAIDVDGDLDDWSTISASYDNSGNSRIREWRFKSDSQKIYFYIKMRKNRSCITYNDKSEISDGKLYIGFNTDNNVETGSSYGNVTGCEAYIKVIPFTNVGEGTTLSPVDGLDANSEVYASGLGSHNGTVYVKVYDPGDSIGSDSSNVYLEISIPREYLNLPAAGNSITVGCSYSWYTTNETSVTLE